MIYGCTLVFQGPLLARIFQEEEKKRKGARSSNNPKNVARNARKVKEKESQENIVVSKIAGLTPKEKHQEWKIPSSLTGVSYP